MLFPKTNFIIILLLVNIYLTYANENPTASASSLSKQLEHNYYQNLINQKHHHLWKLVKRIRPFTNLSSYGLDGSISGDEVNDDQTNWVQSEGEGGKVVLEKSRNGNTEIDVSTEETQTPEEVTNTDILKYLLKLKKDKPRHSRKTIIIQKPHKKHHHSYEKSVTEVETTASPVVSYEEDSSYSDYTIDVSDSDSESEIIYEMSSSEEDDESTEPTTIATPKTIIRRIIVTEKPKRIIKKIYVKPKHKTHKHKHKTTESTTSSTTTSTHSTTTTRPTTTTTTTTTSTTTTKPTTTTKRTTTTKPTTTTTPRTTTTTTTSTTTPSTTTHKPKHKHKHKTVYEVPKHVVHKYHKKSHSKPKESHDFVTQFVSKSQRKCYCDCYN